MNKDTQQLTLVTFSGAQATGKTTLLGDLRLRLGTDDPETTVCVAESCSQKLFQRLQRGELKVPGGVLPQNYDDLNRLGLRDFFQRALPDALCFEIEAAVLQAVKAHKHKPQTVVLVDRWFTDIIAYTRVESRNAELDAEVLDLCRTRYAEFSSWLLSHVEAVRLINVFVPISASTFRVPASSKFRATCDRKEWERVCLDGWRDFDRRRKAFLTIQTADRKRRVDDLIEQLSRNARALPQT